MAYRSPAFLVALLCFCLLLKADLDCHSLPQACQGGAAPSSAYALQRDGTSPDDIILILTNPTAAVLKNFVALVDNKILAVPHLKILGIYPSAESARFATAHTYVHRKQIDWIRLESISCRIPRGRIFTTNECSTTFQDLFEMSAGIIFTGGTDLPPSYYGAETRLTTRINTPRRHVLELSFMYHLLGSGTDPEFKPFLEHRPSYLVLGICLGLQTMNVALGGTLYQDIPAELYQLETAERTLELPRESQHRDYHYFINPSRMRKPWTIHPIQVTSIWNKNSLPAADQEWINVFSSHHQAIKNLASDLLVAATSIDGKVIEAVAHGRYPAVMGLQFHPEYRYWWRSRWYSEDGENGYARGYNDFLFDSWSVTFHRAFWKWVAQHLMGSSSARVPSSRQYQEDASG